jgi:GT2 family glycosyltransferase
VAPRDPVPSAHDITVAVATCGRPDGLRRCLEALAGGTARPGEVIIVDQAPTARAQAAADACTGLEVRYLE